MNVSPNIGLNLISADDTETNVKEWALKLNGDSGNSNAMIIDGEIAGLQEVLNNYVQNIEDHIENSANPHGVTAEQVNAILRSEKNAPGGVAGLDHGGKVLLSQLPPMNYDPAGSAAGVQSNLDSALIDINAELTSCPKTTDVQSMIANATSAKQDKLTFDTTPTAGSVNPVTSGGILTAINNAVALANPWEKVFEKLTTTTVGGIEVVVIGKIDLSKYYALRVNYIDENSRKPGIKMLIDAEESATSYQRVSGTTVTNADIISDEGGYLEIDLCNAKVCVRGSVYFWRVPNLNVTAMRSFTVMPYTGGVMSAGNRVTVYGLKK